MAKNFNQLVKDDPQAAAGIIQDGLRHIVNTMLPGIYLTNEEWHELWPIIVAGEAKCPHETTEGEGTESGSTGTEEGV